MVGLAPLCYPNRTSCTDERTWSTFELIYRRILLQARSLFFANMIYSEKIMNKTLNIYLYLKIIEPFKYLFVSLRINCLDKS